MGRSTTDGHFQQQTVSLPCRLCQNHGSTESAGCPHPSCASPRSFQGAAWTQLRIGSWWSIYNLRRWKVGCFSAGNFPLEQHLLVSSSWGYPHSWRVFVREHPSCKWMITRGTPIYGNLHIEIMEKLGTNS